MTTATIIARKMETVADFCLNSSARPRSGIIESGDTLFIEYVFALYASYIAPYPPPYIISFTR